ncbi:MAG: L,D-transpeptidase family protein [Pseudomonadota bacterium]
MSRILTLLFLGLAFLSSGVDARAQSITQDLSDTLNAQDAVVVDGRIVSADRLMSAYEAVDFRPIWTTERGLSPAGLALRDALTLADTHGLNTLEYEALWPRDSNRLSVEFGVSDVFLTLAHHLHGGRTSASISSPDIVIARKAVDAGATFQRIANGESPDRVLRDLAPQSRQYRALRDMLGGYRRLAADGGWQPVSGGETLKPDMVADRVVEVRQNLMSRGYGGLDLVDELDHYDARLVATIRHFQARHGLEADGIVGKMTIAAMNVPADERVNQIALNMERWRWLPSSLGRDHILVNQASFTLYGVRNGQTDMTMDVVVGKPYHKTPIFSDRIRYVEFNPTWTIPTSIARRTYLPKLKSNPGYFDQNGYRIYAGWGANAARINPFSIDWSRETSGRFDYKIVQDPGPKNALGRVKFMFPNDFAVYLHDTPARSLFARTSRAFSSGCVRLHRPLEFAEYVLRNDGWSRGRVDNVIAGRRTQRVDLSESLPVHLTYFTAWIDPNGMPRFYPDIYDRDSIVDRVLRGAV